MLSKENFDRWSEEYDESIQKSKGYPFEGYYDVLGYVQGKIKGQGTVKVLDIGVGTGQLTQQLYKNGARIFGLDFSEKMIREARKKMPEAVFFQQDLNEGVPTEIREEKFDYIVSSYVLHHFHNTVKMGIIEELRNLLYPKGEILVADVAFENEEDLNRCKQKCGNEWDDEEFYMIGKEMTEALEKNGLESDYQQISSCAGVLSIQSNN
ncbi:class I SAM-dependent methyltransferase [Isachenkonia alkalipeptolytica]|nr:class I SAM-dependent methyltransferase [Isachenkonia alkalipeptolytica]